MRIGFLIEDDFDGLNRAIRCSPNQETSDAYLAADINWIWAKNYEEAVKLFNAYYIKNSKLPDVFAFDHDLGGNSYSLWHKHGGYQTQGINYEEYDEKTGYHFAKWITDFCLDNNIRFESEFYSHSMNSVGRQNILSILTNFKNFQEREK